ncbi:hypothetical protein RRG54_01885 [Mycoplasmopsis felis]|uniref:hypothetical protein n=1 Tax=Mycoplasmopsis felis TaxID=33923 RepID=UPI00300D373A
MVENLILSAAVAFGDTIWIKEGNNKMKFENKFIIDGLVSSITYSKYNNMETKGSEAMHVLIIQCKISIFITL